MSHFEKVSFNEYYKQRKRYGPTEYCLPLEEIKREYDNIKLPVRSTIRSAGYDFYAPYNVTLTQFGTTIPTGIRWVCTDEDTDCCLFCVPRSGLGVRAGFALLNTIGVIDNDYCNSDNEGHIMAMCKVRAEYPLTEGERFMQGIIVPFLKTDNEENVTTTRNGGFGSTDKEN